MFLIIFASGGFLQITASKRAPLSHADMTFSVFFFFVVRGIFADLAIENWDLNCLILSVPSMKHQCCLHFPMASVDAVILLK